jgi:phosphate starvation-inducible protein PhoH and related proteins
MGKRSEPRDSFDLTLAGRKPFTPRGARQGDYYRAMRCVNTVVGIGPAGSGKTYVAASFAAEQMIEGKKKRLILTRPAVAIEGEEHGFLPGDLIKKMAPWTAPVVDVLVERMGGELVTTMLKDGRIQVIPIGFMRGRTFNDAVVLLDEAQNTTPGQMKAVLTRIGENTTYIVDGDRTQTDLSGDNGLEDLLSLIFDLDLPVPVIEFTERDIVRSAACRMWVEAYCGREKHLLPDFLHRRSA